MNIEFIVIIALFGLAIGSFLNVVIYRLPLMLQQQWRSECIEYLELAKENRNKTFNLALPHSHCPHCKHPLAARYNIPLLSFLLLRAKCPYCKQKISWQYPVVELLTAVISGLVAFQFGLSWLTAASLVLSWAIIILTFIDFRHMILPDVITLPLLWLGLLLNTQRMFCSPQTAIIGASIGYLVLWLVAWLFKKIRKIEGMGYGDFKLLALFGAWLGWQQLPFIVIISSLLGIIVGLTLIICKKHQFKKPLPFGPYIAIAGWIALLWGQPILNWYLHFSGAL